MMTDQPERNVTAMKSLRKLAAAVCMIALILCFVPSASAASSKKDKGYSVMHWTAPMSEDEETDFYTVYRNSNEKNGTPTFYCEGRDHYNNIYTGWDVEITFFRQYDAASLEQANALCKYLKNHSDNKYKCAGSYYFKEDGMITSIVVWFMEGWDVEDPDLDFQDLWDKNIWMNCDATGLILEYLGYGRSDEIWNYAVKLGCSSMVTAQEHDEYGFPGVTFGFHFIEGTDDHVVKRYCPNETW